MVVATWRALRPLLPRHRRGLAMSLTAIYGVAGLIEAGVIVLLVGVAVQASKPGDHGAVDLPLPFFDKNGLHAGTALAAMTIGMVLLLALHAVAAVVTARVGAHILTVARTRLLTAFSAASFSRQSHEAEGALQEAVTTLAAGTAQIARHLSRSLATTASMTVLLAAAVVVSPLVTVVTLAGGAVVYSALRLVSRRTHHHAQAHTAASATLAEQVAAWATLARERRVFGVEDAELARLDDHIASSSATFSHARAMTVLGTDLYRDLAMLLLIGAVATVRLTGAVDASTVAAVVLLAVRGLSGAQQATSSQQMVAEALPNLTNLLDRLESLEAVAEPRGTRRVTTFDRIELRDVSYRYGDGRRGIEAISLEIGAADALGLVGPSGGGKTTIAEVIVRLRRPQSGALTVDGLAYDEIDEASWTSLVSFVPQDPRLVRGTIEDNIRFHRPGLSRSDIAAAAASAFVLAGDVGNELTLDTELGSAGVGVSGGQRQRIAIARALAGSPKLLVLDEPTSALDGRSEELLTETLRGLRHRMALLIIAHRPATLACCDRIIEVERGAVSQLAAAPVDRG